MSVAIAVPSLNQEAVRRYWRLRRRLLRHVVPRIDFSPELRAST